MSDLYSLFVGVGVMTVAFVAGCLGWIMVKRERSLRQELLELRRAQNSNVANGGDSAPRASPKPERNLIFLSYSHRDEEFVEELRVHLSPILRAHSLELWSDRNIEAGHEWRSMLSESS